MPRRPFQFLVMAPCLLTFLSFFLSSSALLAQGCSSQTYTTARGGVTIGSVYPDELLGWEPAFKAPPLSVQPACVDVTVPQGRQFVVVNVTEQAGRWQYGKQCALRAVMGQPDGCADVTVSISITGPSGPLAGFPISLTGSATSAAPGSPPAWTGGTCDATNWDATDCVFCLDCFQLCCADEGGYCCGGTGARQLTWCQVPDYVCLANVGPAFGTFDYWLTYTHTSKQLVDVSALTKNGPIVLTIQGTGSGSTYSWPSQINASIDASAQFVMTQTPSDFRPMDARDPAANCPGFSPGSGTSDNCHITYQVELAGPPQGELAGPRTGPMMAAMAPDRRVQRPAQNCARPGRNLSAARFSALPSVAKDYSLSSQVSPFTPGRPFPGGVLPSGGRLAGLAGQRPQPKDVPTLAAFTATYNFSLTLPTAAGGPPVTWLLGTSTNYTPPNTDLNGPDPDYVLETTTNPSLVVAPDGLSAFTPMAVDPTTPTSVVVTSHDFGGVAEFRATATVQAVTPTGTTGPLTVDVVVNNGLWAQDPVPAPSDSPTRLCGTDFANHPFASLPVDQDCNGIADSWEDANSTQNGVHLPPDWDQEPGYLPTSPKGDGLTVHDEYRGFHYFDATAKATKWASTDPVGKQDVFFLADWNWPDGRAVASSINGILARETPFMAWHRVQDAYAGAANGAGRNRINRYSAGLNQVFAIVYQDGNVKVDANNKQDYGTLAESGGFAVDGKTPILVYTGSIAQAATNLKFPLDVLQDEVIAHETGHKLDLAHPTRPNCCQFVAYNANSLQNDVGWGQFTFDAKHNTVVYARYHIYVYTTPRIAISDQLYTAPWSLHLTSLPGPPPVPAQTPIGRYQTPNYGYDGAAVYRLQLDGGVPAGVTGAIIQYQEGFMMDWTPRLLMQTSPEWHYYPSGPEGLAHMCVKVVCN